MKNIKYVFGSFLLIVILIPQITSASWLNPLTWLTNKPTAPVVQQSGQTYIPSKIAKKVVTPKKKAVSQKSTITIPTPPVVPTVVKEIPVVAPPVSIELSAPEILADYTSMVYAMNAKRNTDFPELVSLKNEYDSSNAQADQLQQLIYSEENGDNAPGLVGGGNVYALQIQQQQQQLNELITTINSLSDTYNQENHQANAEVATLYQQAKASFCLANPKIINPTNIAYCVSLFK